MSRLPEPGDADRAAVAMNARLLAGVGEPEGDEHKFVTAGNAVVDGVSGAVSGEGADPLRRVYGDLVDVGEVVIACDGMVETSASSVEAMLVALRPAMATLSLQSVAFGVLMERQRWERAKGAGS